MRSQRAAIALAVVASVASMPTLAGKSRGVGKIFERNSVQSDYWTGEYDDYFRKYTKRYFGPHFDWHWFKAQAIAESALNIDAESHVGAQGLMQIMPETFAEIRSLNPHFERVDNARWNIAAGIYYDRYLYRQWSEVGGVDRMYFTFASYNAGLGGMMRGVKKAGKGTQKTWANVKAFMPLETQGYIQRITVLKKSSAINVSERRSRGEKRFLSKFSEG